jgi:hypothetical protein
MALIISVLQEGFRALFEANNLSPQSAANSLANTYRTYAQTGMFGAGIPVFTGIEEKVLASFLLASFSNPQPPNPAAWGLAWANGIASFWMTPPVLISGGQIGAVTAITGVLALPAALQAMLVPQQSAATAASTLAALLHATTLTVAATVSPPPGTLVTIL